MDLDAPAGDADFLDDQAQEALAAVEVEFVERGEYAFAEAGESAAQAVLGGEFAAAGGEFGVLGGELVAAGSERGGAAGEFVEVEQRGLVPVSRRMPAAEVALALGAGAVALRGAAAACSRRTGPPLADQALGMAVVGVVVAAEDAIAGSGFDSSLRPALGKDRLSGIFLAALAMVAVPALVYAGGYLAGSRSRRATAALTSAFLLALVLVLLARDVTTRLAGHRRTALAIS